MKASLRHYPSLFNEEQIKLPGQPAQLLSACIYKKKRCPIFWQFLKICTVLECSTSDQAVPGPSLT